MNDLIDSNGDCYSILEEHLGEKQLKRSFCKKYFCCLKMFQIKQPLN